MRSNKELYQQTLTMAAIIAEHQGFTVEEGLSISDGLSSGRGRAFFEAAIDIQTKIFGHEMQDVLSDTEESE